MIYIVGDTHIPVDISKLNERKFPMQENMNRDDFVIICGDFGGIWDNGEDDMYWLEWLNNRNFTTLFIDGNHENFELLNKYEVQEFNGGKVHKIRDNIYHLMRGQVFTLKGQKFFTMGGAKSHDKHCRKEGVSWWAEELPNDLEYEEANRNLELNDWKVDYVITHCASNRIITMLMYGYGRDKLTTYFEDLEDKLTFKKWYFGHYHMDRAVTDRHNVLYEHIVRCDYKKG